VAQPAATIEPKPTTGRQPLQRRGALRIGLRVLADGIAVSAALFTASAIRFEFLDIAPARGLDYTLITIVATPAWLLLFWLYGLYEPRQVLSPVGEFKQVFHGVLGGVVAIFVADSLFRLNLARGWALLVMVCGFVMVAGERLVGRKFLHFMRRRGAENTRTIVLGSNHEARTVARTLQRESWLGYSIVGFVADDTREEQVGGRIKILGRVSELRNLIEEHGVTLVVVAATAIEPARLNRLLWELQDLDIDLQITSGTLDLVASRMSVQSVAGIPLLFIRRTGMNRVQRTLKRTMDIAASGVGLIVLAPVLAIIALWIKKESPGPVFFKQKRVGRDGKEFVCWKYRTMVADAEERKSEIEHLSEGPGFLFKIKEDPRVTRAGRVLRRYSFDELPQLVNVLRGDMSLVGPRPALPTEVEQYDDWVRNRLAVKPGMTGLWQVSGRTETSFSDYVRYDLFYIQNWSLSLDLWILSRTLRAVLSAEGAH
jgi:exopolysaccharide biosynthesis polyprenyl glycosylphosphotransferase